MVEKCKECHGKGTILLLVSSVPCTVCNGTGEITIPDAPTQTEEPGSLEDHSANYSGFMDKDWDY